MTHGSDADFWDRMYRHRKAAPWSGEPNVLLAETAADLPPGAALDVGCGEGADAIWLAKCGWTVTAVDHSNVALDCAREADSAGQVRWLQADLLDWQPPSEAYDLVSAHFLHVAPEERGGFFGRLAMAVRPGGTLLFVAHHPSDLETAIGRPPIPDLYFTAEEVAATLETDGWELLISGTRPRSASAHGGGTITVHDMVLKARRLP
ncbi:class I SAM-dependent methyltransferase [Vulgatibacter incomptus]|uniref:Thioredoxin reductase n=1 Tax=Vulgatibacter incomptus TaxID=1391653 RepID=A0A0K1PGJ2_9BACT|nr:class I SAM-dependent methyltransferase [Vulgatibacter incomptus]AKU92627.1 Thioredoxin reductase [Vulgatibacter incomptus]